ncbi:hypothetical protein Tco_0779061 [Tanacetum coccineum]
MDNLSTFESVLAFRRNTKVVRDIVLLSREDIEVGRVVRPHLALRVANSTSAWKKPHGKEVIIKCKFAADRI